MRDSFPCCLHIRGPAMSTLFPYTTLFRSRRFPRRIFARAPGNPEVNAGRDGGWTRRSEVETETVLRDRGCDLLYLRVHHRDRKSTRLNSSHSQTSYAVFCLKKKIHLPSPP